MGGLLACQSVTVAALSSSRAASPLAEGLQMGDFRRLREMREQLGSNHCCLQSSLVSRSLG